jgi:hypothetical protein
MPRRFLSQAERTRLCQFPSEISASDCVVYFTLTPADLEAVGQRRKDENHLGFALLLCALRYLGYFPAEIQKSPEHIVTYVASQLQVTPESLADYALREETRWEHLPILMAHLGFRRVNANDKQTLVAWLGDRALEHDRPKMLLQQACERLYQLCLVRPSITTVEEFVASARQWAEAKTIEVLVNPLTAPVRKTLDNLLVKNEASRMAPVVWLRRFATGHSDKDILETLDKLAFIDQWAVSRWQVSSLPPSRLKSLAQVARYTSTQGLQRKQPLEKRYAILVAFLRWAHEKTIDELGELFDLCLAAAHRKSRRELVEFQLRSIADMQRLMGYFREMGQVVVDDAVPDEAVRANIYQHIPADTLQTALDSIDGFFIHGRKQTDLDFFDKRYSYFRRFTPAFLKALTFHNYTDREGLLKALAVLREMNETSNKLPATLEEVPIDFVKAPWRERVLNKDGTVKRRDYEMCALSELRDGLRCGAIWVLGSRKYANIDSYLIPKARWEQLRQTYCDMVGMPEDGKIKLAMKQSVLEEGLARLDSHLPQNEFVRIENGELVLSPLDKEEAEIRKQPPLAEKIGALLPSIQLGQLLAEVDTWTRFSQQFTHAGGATSRTDDLVTQLYAAILTQACNMTLSGMASLSDLSHDQLLWCTNQLVYPRGDLTGRNGRACEFSVSATACPPLGKRCIFFVRWTAFCRRTSDKSSGTVTALFWVWQRPFSADVDIGSAFAIWDKGHATDDAGSDLHAGCDPRQSDGFGHERTHD